ncbi:Multicopper oxidase [compost metagenome]
MLSGAYKPTIKDADKPDKAKWENGDPGVGMFLQLRVQSYAGQDLAMNPADYEPAKPAANGQPAKPAGLKMIPLTIDRNNPADRAKLAQARHRTFVFGRNNNTDEQPWTIKVDDSLAFSMDPRRISAAPQLATGPTQAGFSGDGTLEVWKIENSEDEWEHPVHVHFEEGIILSRGGKAPPVWEQWARKDVYRVGALADSDTLRNVEVAIRFREFAGTYMEHCHNTQHEDTSMLLRWDVEYPGQFQLMPTPLPTWDGVTYAPSVALPTFRKGDGKTGPQMPF